MPAITTGLERLPRNRTSDSQPAARFPATPNISASPMTCVAFSREKSFCFCRNSTPQSLTACWVIYKNAVDIAMTHIPGCLNTHFWSSLVGFLSMSRTGSPESS